MFWSPGILEISSVLEQMDVTQRAGVPVREPVYSQLRRHARRLLSRPQGLLRLLLGGGLHAQITVAKRPHAHRWMFFVCVL